MAQKIAIIGGGVGGLAVACLLAKAGHQVTVFEKNAQLGGRAGLLRAKGFRFDTGPSWYLMPKVFERFFGLLDEDLEAHLTLHKLTPAYRVFDAAGKQHVDITGQIEQDAASFAQIEPGGGEQLQKYAAQMARVHDIVSKKVLYSEPRLGRELVTSKLAARHLSSSMHQDAAKHFRTPLLQQIIEYPAMFLGTSPYRAPALYGMLNHCLFTEGVFYPEGGLYQLVEALVNIGKKYGVVYRTNAPTSKIVIKDGRARGVMVHGELHAADIVISNAGKYHTETALLDPSHRDHSPGYWQRRDWSPSALLLYLGLDRQYASLAHHNLLFNKNWRRNFTEIFGHNSFPDNPSLYVCAPSKTDPGIAPKGCENLMVLVPVSAGLQYTERQLEAFRSHILMLLEKEMQLKDLGKHIVYQKTVCVQDFAQAFNSHLGSGLGLSHTLRQSAMFRPGNTSKKVQGLHYVGADVHPGVGLPPVLISAELLYNRLSQQQD
jgi:phytoene desaturase